MADRKATIELSISSTGEVEIREVKKLFDASGKSAEKSAKMTTDSWGKVKKTMSDVTKTTETFMGRFTSLAQMTEKFIDTSASLAKKVKATVVQFKSAIKATKDLVTTMIKGKKTIEDNTSAWSRFKKMAADSVDSTIKNIKELVKSVFSLKGIIATLAGTAGVGALVKSFIDVAAKVEGFKTRLIAMTKSSELANRKLKILSDFAGKAPFELPEIIEAGITLEAFGAKVKNTIKPVGDLAAFMGTTLVEASKAFGRAFAAGAGAADILRDRGVLAMVKLKTGVENLTTLTLPEFRKALLETLTDPDGKIFGATELLRKTFVGQVSMMTDSIFNLKLMLGTALMPAIQNVITKRITPLVKKMAAWAEANQDIIEQKFDQVVTGIADAIEGLVRGIEDVVSWTRDWWKENRELIITLGQLWIATKAAGIIIGVMVKVAIAAKILLFAKSIGLLAAGTTVLTVSMWLLKPALLAVAAGFALLIGIKVGTWLSDWITGLDKVQKSVQDLEINTERLQKRASNKLSALGFSGLDEFNEAVEKGIITYSKVSRTWEKVQKSVDNSLNSMTEKVKEATDKIAGTWDAMGKKLKESFAALDIFPKAKLDAQAKSLTDAFKLVVKKSKLSNDDLLTARNALFKKLKELNKKAGEASFPVGFNPQETKHEIERVFDEVTGTATFRLKDMADKLATPSRQVGDTIFAGMTSGSDKISGFMERSADTLTVTIKKQAIDIDQFISSTISEAQNMFGVLSASIEKLDTEIPVSIIDNATPVIQEIQFELEALHDKTITITTRHINIGSSDSGSLFPAHNSRSLFPAHNSSETVSGSFAGGLLQVPKDMNVRVHRDESILPAPVAREFRASRDDNRRIDQRTFSDNRQFNINTEPSSVGSVEMEFELRSMSNQSADFTP